MNKDDYAEELKKLEACAESAKYLSEELEQLSHNIFISLAIVNMESVVGSIDKRKDFLLSQGPDDLGEVDNE